MTIPSSDCPKCGQLIVHDIVEPFAHCGCGTSEWYEHCFTPAMKMQKRMYETMRIVENGAHNLLNALQSRTHLVKYCKSFNLPALWESKVNDRLEDLRWFDQVITGLEYSIITPDQLSKPYVPFEGQQRIFTLPNLLSDVTPNTLYTKRVLAIKMYSPGKYNYFIFVPVDLADFVDKAKFDLEKILDRKLKDFDRKAILLVERRVRKVVQTNFYLYQ